LTISNTGNATLTVNNISLSTPDAADFALSWTSGAIAAGATQSVSVRFKPTEAKSYNGTLTIVGDQTSGTNASAISGAGTMTPHAPKTTFGSGTYAVNSEIAAGRYFARPGHPCNLKRLAALGSAPADVIMWELIDDAVDQWIVDVAPSDAYFQTDA